MYSEQFRHMRERLNLTQQDFANALGVHVSTVRRYEKPRVQVNQTVWLAALCLFNNRVWHDVIVYRDGKVLPTTEAEVKAIGLKVALTVDRVRIWREAVPGQLPTMEETPFQGLITTGPNAGRVYVAPDGELTFLYKRKDLPEV